MKLSVIITAGGHGKRFDSSIPKQFLPLTDIPILMRTIDVFYNWNSEAEIILTLPKAWRSYWDGLVDQYEFKTEHVIVDGGKERYHSIKNALSLCKGEHVLIHDGVRPLVNTQTLNRCMSALKTKKAVVPFLAIKESIRLIQNNGSVSLDRKKHVRVQTPQCFDTKLILKAYQGEYQSCFTDDASVIEERGTPVYLVEGNEENIKITTPLDLQIAEALIKNSQ